MTARDLDQHRRVYQPRRPVRCHWHEIRDVRYRVRTWGEPDGELLFLLHGWMDTGATFQFLVDCLDERRYVVAPDWRGFGDSGRARGGYWFPDYLSDLDVLAELYSADLPLDLVGHSMGGNVACLYAGVRPERVRRLVTLEALGIPDAPAERAPERYRRWLSELDEPPGFTPRDSYQAVADELQRRHPHLPAERALYVARAWMQEAPDGGLVPRGDPVHKRVNPVLYRVAETEACWSAITAPVLLVTAEDSRFVRYTGGEAEIERRQGYFGDLSVAALANCGHMLHHDQPEELARLLEAFLAN